MSKSKKNITSVIKRWKIKRHEKKNTNSSLKKSHGFWDFTKTISKRVKKNRFSILEVIVIVFITAVISGLIGNSVSKSEDSENYTSVSPAMQKFLEQYNAIVSNYYTKVDESSVLEKALESVVNSLGDPFSEVIDSSLSNSMATTLQGSYKGLGIEVTNNSDGNVEIASILSDSPASKADIKVGDVITKYNDESVTGMTTSDFATKVLESSSNTAKLTILRDGNSFDVTVTKETVVLKSVSYTTYNVNNHKIGYIDVSVFAANTDEQFKEALKALEASNIDSIIVDLRNNTGGHLSAVENMMSDFLDSSNVIYQIKTKTKTTKYYSKGSVTKKYPMVVLVNGSSASASEMFTAAMSEDYGAKVVGTTTYGKGTVQEVFSTSTGTDYKLTTEKWLTPKGIWINGKGIKPDIEVALSSEYISNPTTDNDNQLQAAFTALTK